MIVTLTVTVKLSYMHIGSVAMHPFARVTGLVVVLASHGEISIKRDMIY